MVRFHNPFPERIGQVVRQLHEFIKESRTKKVINLLTNQNQYGIINT
jgi:hypothetical protein